VPELLRRFVFAPAGQVRPDEPLDVELRLLRRDAAEERPANRGVTAEASAQKDVVTFELFTRLAPLAQRRALEADVAGEVLCAGVRTAVDVHAQAFDLAVERGFEVLDDLGELRLRRGDRVVAERLARAAL